MVKTTRKQREALFRVFQRDFPGWITPTTRHEGTYCPHCGQWSNDQIIKVSSRQWRRFRKQVYPAFDKSGCIIIPWKTMWLGIETDGHTHS
jgi:hypothetical protein